QNTRPSGSIQESKQMCVAGLPPSAYTGNRPPVPAHSTPADEHRPMNLRLSVLTASLFSLLSLLAHPGVFQAGETKPGIAPTSPPPPRDEQATFRAPKGFRVDLVACEPDIVDPVALAFDEDGRLYVAEMHGYPNAGVATGIIPSGKIKLLHE